MPITLMGPCTGHLGTISTFCPDYTNSEMTPFSNWLLMKSCNSQYGFIIKGSESSSGSSTVLMFTQLHQQKHGSAFGSGKVWRCALASAVAGLRGWEWTPSHLSNFAFFNAGLIQEQGVFVRRQKRPLVLPTFTDCEAPTTLKANEFISFPTSKHVA